MRRILILAATIAMLAVVAAPAQAAVTESLTASVSPTNAGTKRQPVKSNVLLDASIRQDSAGARLPVTDRLILDVEKNIVFNGKYFPSCSAAKLDAGKDADLPACRSAKIGESVASAQVYGEVTGQINFSVTIYNGPLGKSQIAYVVVPGTSVKKAMVGKITRSSSPYGLRVTYVIPPELKQPLPGVFPSLDRFKVTKLSRTTSTARPIRVGSRVVRRKVGYVESIGCTGGKFNTRVSFDFTSPAPTVSKKATSTCRK